MGRRFVCRPLAVVLAWLSLFGLRLLSGLGGKAIAWGLISAVACWPLVYHGRLRWFVVARMACASAIDIFHVHFFRTLTDQFILVTALRTTPSEMMEFARVLPIGPLAGSMGWLLWCVLVGRFLERGMPSAVQKRGALAECASAVLLAWIPARQGAEQHRGAVLGVGQRKGCAQVPELFASLRGEHGNALLAEGAVRAVGYGALLAQPDWPSSRAPRLEGKTWEALRQMDVCTLR